jgi:hypothetical protein
MCSDSSVGRAFGCYIATRVRLTSSRQEPKGREIETPLERLLFAFVQQSSIQHLNFCSNIEYCVKYVDIFRGGHVIRPVFCFVLCIALDLQCENSPF